MREGISRAVIATGVCGALLTAPSVAGAADAIYGLTDNNRLVRFNSDSPSEAQQILAVQGLQQGETLVGIDTRAQNDTLYAVGTTNRVYQVNPVTGATRPAFGPFSLGLNGASFGIDVNPVADSLRIVSDAEQNLRVAFVGGDAGAAQAEGALQYAAGDPGAGSDPSVGAAAYTNSVPGASQTTLYDIDTARDVLVRQDPPGTGTLVTVGALGFDARSPPALTSLRRATSRTPRWSARGRAGRHVAVSRRPQHGPRHGRAAGCADRDAEAVARDRGGHRRRPG